MKHSFKKPVRYTSGLENAMSLFSRSVGFHKEVRDHLTQKEFLPLVVATEGYIWCLTADLFHIQINNQIYLMKH